MLVSCVCRFYWQKAQNTSNSFIIAVSFLSMVYRINKCGNVWRSLEKYFPPLQDYIKTWKVISSFITTTFSTLMNGYPVRFSPKLKINLKCNGWQGQEKNEWRTRQKRMRVWERKRECGLTDYLRLQEQTQQPTLPQSIRVMEWKGGRGGRSEGHRKDEPICLIGHQKREGGRKGGCVIMQGWQDTEVRGWAHRRRGFLIHKPIASWRLNIPPVCFSSNPSSTHQRAGQQSSHPKHPSIPPSLHPGSI